MILQIVKPINQSYYEFQFQQHGSSRTLIDLNLVGKWKRNPEVEKGNRPADPEGERGGEDLGGEDTENGREEAEEDGSTGFEENRRRQTESDGESVDGDEERNRPHPQSL